MTVPELIAKKGRGEKITVLTAYDFTIASLLDKAGLDIILVGDSAANVMQGHSTTLPITLKELMIYARSVSCAVKNAMVVVDLPFGYYQANSKGGLKAAIKIIKKTGAQAVKLEGGQEILKTIQKLKAADIPVMGHLGLRPQSIHTFGSYSVQAQAPQEAEKLLADAKALQAEGCFAIVLEKIPQQLAAQVSQELDIPTIGIGAGPKTDGQVLVTQDMLGMNSTFKPKFVKHYANLESTIVKAVKTYIQEVQNGAFPTQNHSYNVED